MLTGHTFNSIILFLLYNVIRVVAYHVYYICSCIGLRDQVASVVGVKAVNL